MARSTPKTIRPGDSITAKTINRDIAKALQTATGVAQGNAKRQLGKSVTISSNVDMPPQSGALRFVKAKIVTLNENYMECLVYNEKQEAVTAQVINVAKQRRFRTSFYDAAVITYPNGDVITYTKDATNPTWKRQANNGATTVNQIPIPCWYVGEVIRCLSTATSVVTLADSLPIFWEEDEPREWAVI